MHEPRAHPHVLLASSFNCSQPARLPPEQALLSCLRAQRPASSSSSRRLLNHFRSSPSPSPIRLVFNSVELELDSSLEYSTAIISLHSIPSTTHRLTHGSIPSTALLPEMGKKGLVSIFSRLVDSGAASSKPTAAASPPWPWPPCGTNPQTASFRAGAGAGDDDEPCCTSTAAAAGGAGKKLTVMAHAAAPGEMYKTVNSVYQLDDPAADDFFSFSLARDGDEEGVAEVLYDLHDDDDDDDDDSFSTTTASEEWSEAVIRSLGRTSTDRFFFDPPGPLPASNSILATAAPGSEPARKKKALPASTTEQEEKMTVNTPPVGPDDADDDVVVKKQPQPQLTTAAAKMSLAERSVAVAVDSGDPYGDFRASMEEMVSAHGLRDWAALEELLAWYLRINGKQHHHLIVGAFVDLLLGLSSSSSSSSPPSSTAAETSTTTTTTTTSSSHSSSTTTGSRCTSTTAAPSAAAVVVEHERGGGNQAAPCSSSSSSSSSSSYRAAPADVEAAAVDDEEATQASAGGTGSDGDRVRATGSAPLRLVA
ncbi:hypothetical protein BDA96_08G045700 [Sorghum bicolor]|uniref:OVATE domain-containing protein n=1 Tax=Sorghum bicolor TaxID=4558 RepID=A0A921QFL9_SORBI|nr:hypothetical protein BDA96_08G045700 [Sorghum bicolor]